MSGVVSCAGDIQAPPRGCLEVRGYPRHRGRVIGHRLREPIVRFLADGRARLDRLLPSPPSPAALRASILAHLAVIERVLPEVAEELHGLAEGAEISYEQAGLLQLRRELMGYSRLPCAGDCTTFGLWRGDDSVVGQTIDLNGGMAELGTVLRIRERADVPEVLMFTFAGLLGYLGLNSAGLAVGINLVLGGVWGPGVPPYLLVRQLLRCRDIDGCLAELERLPSASSRALTLVDRWRAVTVELTPEARRVSEGERLLHTNHFLHRDFQAAERMNPFHRNGSRRRLERLEQLLDETPAGRDAEHYFAILADHSLFPAGICVHNDGDIRREETVAAVVMFPATGTLHVRRGHPCRGASERFSL